MLTHLCAAAALTYAGRIARIDASWLELPPLEAAPGQLPSVSVVVPARDEARSIERCVRSLLSLRWVDLEVIAVDDCSSDATPAILARIAKEDARLRVVRGEPLPAGWVGKPWALHQGARQARGEWLLFTDADSWHAPVSAATSLHYATRAGVDALSLATYQELESFWERALLPSILGLVLVATGPLNAINDPQQPGSALLNGQYVLVSRRAYDALGGHDALRAEIAEDLEFARRLKADGRFRMLLVAGERLVRVRMYRSFGEIWRGFRKNVYVGTRGDVVRFSGGLAFVVAISALPPLLALRALRRGRHLEALEALACTAVTVAAAARAIGRTHHSPRLGFFQPLGTAIFAAIALDSALSVLGGRGVTWRGRSYKPTGSEAYRDTAPRSSL